MLLVGVTGRRIKKGKTIGIAQAGKDTVCRYFAETRRMFHVAFAKRLKATVKTKFALTDEECAEKNKEKVIARWGMSFRQMCQLEGTEAGWQLYDKYLSIGPSLWVRHVDHIWKVLQNGGHEYPGGLVISDVRFPHEVKWIKEHDGIVVMVTRPTDVDAPLGIKKHASETYEAPFDYEIENGRLNVKEGAPQTKAWLPDLQSRAETAIWAMEEKASIPHPDAD